MKGRKNISLLLSILLLLVSISLFVFSPKQFYPPIILAVLLFSGNILVKLFVFQNIVDFGDVIMFYGLIKRLRINKNHCIIKSITVSNGPLFHIIMNDLEFSLFCTQSNLDSLIKLIKELKCENVDINTITRKANRYFLFSPWLKK